MPHNEQGQGPGFSQAQGDVRQNIPKRTKNIYQSFFMIKKTVTLTKTQHQANIEHLADVPNISRYAPTTDKVYF